MERGGAARALPVLALVALLGACAAAAPEGDCPPCPLRPPAACHFKNFVQPDVCYYTTNNPKGNLEIKYSRNSFELKCVPGLSLESTSLPRFESLRVIPSVKLVRCALPGAGAGGGSVARALRRLNITGVARLSLEHVDSPTLRADHFHNFDNLKKLDIIAEPHISIENNKTNFYFPTLKSLTTLELTNVHLLSFETISNLTNLKTLKLEKCYFNELHKEHLCNLSVLNTLTITDSSIPNISLCRMSNLTNISLTVDKRLRRLPAFLEVKHLSLNLKFKERKPTIGKFENCSMLETLTVYNMYWRSLPADWLERCGSLRLLQLSAQGLAGAASARALLGAGALQALVLRNTAGITLASDFFQHTPNIRTLDLSNNQLTFLPYDVFVNLTELRSLDLSYNRLTAAAARELNYLARLHTLRLTNNPLGDLCRSDTGHVSSRTSSSLSGMTDLQELTLAATGATRVCPDWRLRLRKLSTLNLEHNDHFTLKWEDLHNWSRKVEIRLTHNNLKTIHTYSDNYRAAIKTSQDDEVNFVLDSELRCDCNMYWFAKAMSEGLVGAKFSPLRCAVPPPAPSPAPSSSPAPAPAPADKQGVLLREFPLDLMVCSIAEGCPAGCLCIKRPEDESASIECQSNGFTTLPNVSAVDSDNMVLVVYNNSIEAVPDELPAGVRALDLRRNALAGAGERGARTLLARGRRVWLAGNPLRCGCDQPLVAALRTHLDQIMDLNVIICEDGQLLREALLAGCAGVRGAVRGAGGAVRGAGALAWAAAGAALALLAAAALAAALRRHVRLRLKAFLLARGFCLAWVLPDDDDDCKFDAFLSYAHEDYEIAEALLAQLESGARPLRVCVHHRDWRPGEWIPKQIAESVKHSHRTIILLSENFSKSSWARAEFREAYAHALSDNAVRLIVIVVGDAPPADLEPEIQHYVSNNTYVRWGEPAFWEKLRVALPAGRPRPPAPAPSPTPAPAPAPSPPPQRAPFPSTPAPAPAAAQLSPQPPTPTVKLARIDFPTPIKAKKVSAPPCA